MDIEDIFTQTTLDLFIFIQLVVYIQSFVNNDLLNK